MSKTKVAQIGVGYWGPALLRNLVNSPRCEVVCVADLSVERQQFVRDTFPQIRVTDRPDEIFSDPDIDAVVIATPAATHFELALEALESGKHVLVEKPMASTAKEVQKLGLVAQDKGLTAMVGHTFLYNHAVHYLRDIINLGELGQVRYIYSQRLNLGRIRSDCDVVWNLAPHDISIIQFLLGDPFPLSVQSFGMDYVQKGIDDVAFVNLVYPNRVMAHFHLSWLDPNRTRSLTIVGSEKMAVYDDTQDQKITIYDKGIDRFHSIDKNMDYDRPTFNLRSGNVYRPTVKSEEPLAVEISHFLDCIEGKAECWSGPEHAAKVVKILELCSKNKSSMRSPTTSLDSGAVLIPGDVWK